MSGWSITKTLEMIRMTREKLTQVQMSQAIPMIPKSWDRISG